MKIENMNNSNIEKFSPVIIPTLNRFEHFYQCLESLEKCRYSDLTDIFIGLDYPPSDYYREGWEKINSYLLEKEKQNNFKSLTVFRRDHNCGISGEGNNYELLSSYVLERYDRLILSEDDNIFSYRFLDYINNGLCKYENDKSIFAICGYQYADMSNSFQSTVIKLDEFSAWGYGIWKDRVNLYNNYLSKEAMKTILDDKKYIKRCKDISNKMRLCSLVRMYKGGEVWGDSLISSILIHLNMKCIFPIVTLVKNNGWDGSGSHGGKVEGFNLREIDESTDNFCFIESEGKESLKIIEFINKALYTKKWNIQNTLASITWIIYEKTGFYYGFGKFRKIWRKIRNYYYKLYK